VDDYEAAFSDEDEEAEGKGQSLIDGALSSDIAASLVEETYNSAEVGKGPHGFPDDKNAQRHTSESTSGDSDSESPRPLSPGHVSAQYYYFYQGTRQRFPFKIALVANSMLLARWVTRHPVCSFEQAL